MEGSVSDLTDAVEPGTKLFFVNESTTDSAETDSEGKYSLWLAAGTYDILLRPGVSFANYRRARVVISCANESTTNFYNFYLLPECVSYGCDRLGYHFDILSPKVPDSGSNLVIAYMSKKTSKGKAVYDDALLTYRNYTLYAEGLIWDLNVNALYASGPGWIESGRSRERFDRKQIPFADELLRGKFTSRTIKDRENLRELRKFDKTNAEARTQ